MSGKQAKKLRKEMKKKADAMVEENMMRKLAADIPIAGCPTCQHQGWYLELDAMPPNHRFITHFICMYPTCNQKVVANVDLERDPEAVAEREKETVPVEVICEDCGFSEDDCQCED